MKRLLLIGALLLVINLSTAQSIQLPGIGSTDIQWSSSQINSAAQLNFSNPEYNVTGFTVKFPTPNNPDYTATSANNHFTQEMLTNIPLLVSGGTILLDVVLKAPGDDHESWHKNYQVHLN